MALLTTDQAKAHLNLRDELDEIKTAQLTEAISAVTASIEHVVGPVIGRDETSIIPGGVTAWSLPFRNVTGLVSGAAIEDGTAVDVSGMYVTAADIVTSKNGSVLSGTAWTLTYSVGMGETIPANIVQAAKETLKLAWAAQQGGELPAFDLSYRVQALLRPNQKIDGFA